MVFIGEVKEKVVTSRELMAFKGHSHSELEELLICLTGITGVRIGENQDFYLSPGEGILLEPGKDHLMWDASKEKNTSYYNSFYSGNLPLFRGQVNIPFNTEKLAVNHFWNYDWNYELSDNKPEEEIIYQIVALLLTLDSSKSDFEMKGKNPSIKSRIQTQTLETNIREQLSLIIRNEPDINHSLAELGKKFYLEPKYLSQKVKKITGLPVMTIYFQIKMKSAGNLLLKGFSVKDTAYTMGFKNPYHFSRKFKEIMGVSPSLFQNNKASL